MALHTFIAFRIPDLLLHDANMTSTKPAIGKLQLKWEFSSWNWSEWRLQDCPNLTCIKLHRMNLAWFLVRFWDVWCFTIWWLLNSFGVCLISVQCQSANRTWILKMMFCPFVPPAKIRLLLEQSQTTSGLQRTNDFFLFLLSGKECAIPEKEECSDQCSSHRELIRTRQPRLKFHAPLWMGRGWQSLCLNWCEFQKFNTSNVSKTWFGRWVDKPPWGRWSIIYICDKLPL